MNDAQLRAIRRRASRPTRSADRAVIVQARADLIAVLDEVDRLRTVAAELYAQWQQLSESLREATAQLEPMTDVLRRCGEGGGTP